MRFRWKTENFVRPAVKYWQEFQTNSMNNGYSMIKTLSQVQTKLRNWEKYDWIWSSWVILFWRKNTKFGHFYTIFTCVSHLNYIFSTNKKTNIFELKFQIIETKLLKTLVSLNTEKTMMFPFFLIWIFWDFDGKLKTV